MEPQILRRAEHPISRRDIHPNVLKVLYRLSNSGHTAYLVGGGVRDLMLRRQPKDFDVATSAHPQQVRDLFRNSRLIGRRFRLVHVFFGPHNIEVATFRRQAEAVVEDADVLIRHDNTFGTAEEDAFRRDFTVNALFYDPTTFHVIDYIGGVADLEARLIRTIGDPELRVREDPVRMIRAVRFAAKLGFEIEEATRRAIEHHQAEIIKSSPPRLVEEIFRTLAQPTAARALSLMDELGLLAMLLPGLAAHLELDGLEPGQTPTGRNIRALEDLIASGAEPDRGFVLACLFLDLDRASRAAPDRDPASGLSGELRARGFARGDTEHMRLLMDAFAMFITRSRRARRLVRRPYYAHARRLHELLARNYGDDPAELDRFLAAPHVHVASEVAAHPAEGGRRRRRRRGGRRHRMRDGGSANGRAPSTGSEGTDSEPRGKTGGHPSGHPRSS